MNEERLIPGDLHAVFVEMLNIYSELSDIAEDVLSSVSALDPGFSKFATVQINYFISRCRAATILWQGGSYWDCEILMRPALECATRLIYVSIANGEERKNRIEEFNTSLWEIDRLNASERAKPAVDASVRPEIEVLIGGIILSEAEESELREKWPRKLRKSLAQKWSFSEMVREISVYHENGLDLRKYPTLLHGYSISSHLIHADSTGISLIWDQDTRPKEEGILKARAHATRLLSDQLSFLYLIVRALAVATSCPPDNRLAEATKRLLKFDEAIEIFHERFLESQRHEYET